jgi:hypothetical protein
MFNFMKKGLTERDREKMDRDEKERRKREKKLRKEVKQGNMSTEELLRLDEVSFLPILLGSLDPQDSTEIQPKISRKSIKKQPTRGHQTNQNGPLFFRCGDH